MGLFSTPTTAQQLATIRANQTEYIIPDLRTIINLLTSLETKMAEDFTHLNQALLDLKAEVTASADNMDKLFADLQAALATGNQSAIDAATAAVQAQIDAMKASVAKDMAP